MSVKPAPSPVNWVAARKQYDAEKLVSGASGVEKEVTVKVRCALAS